MKISEVELWSDRMDEPQQLGVAVIVDKVAFTEAIGGIKTFKRIEITDYGQRNLPSADLEHFLGLGGWCRTGAALNN